MVDDSAWFDSQPKPVRNTLIAGVIQNFEFVYEMSVKMIRRRLEADAFTPEEIDASNFREVLRIAGEKGLIQNVEDWFDLIDWATTSEAFRKVIEARRVLIHSPADH